MDCVRFGTVLGCLKFLGTKQEPEVLGLNPIANKGDNFGVSGFEDSKCIPTREMALITTASRHLISLFIPHVVIDTALQFHRAPLVHVRLQFLQMMDSVL